jgi:hypothetical protein
MESHVLAEAENGFLIAADELLLIGKDPRLEYVGEANTRRELELLLLDERRLCTKVLPVPVDTHVSAVQVAVWFARGQLMVASVGRNTVETQRWGYVRVKLQRWPGEAVGQLATLWLPLTEGAGGSNMRWRVSLAYTGPDDVLSKEIPPAERRAGSPTGFLPPGAIALSELQRNVVVERFAQWLSFPAGTYEPRTLTVKSMRPSENGAGRREHASQRRDTRLDRLQGVRAQLERYGYAGPYGPDFLAALVDQTAIRPGELYGYEELDLGLLVELKLLPRSPSP